MVIIEDFFIHYKQPEQFIFAGENYVDVYKLLNKSFQKTGSVEGISFINAAPDEFGAVVRELAPVDTGVILNSGYYIFNILDFEKIPLRDSLRQEIVEWRLRKVFPEDIDEYDHQFFTLNRKKILSILFKKSLKEVIEERFASTDQTLTYTGNSTVNIMNHVLKEKVSPDFFIEINGDLFVIVFQERSIPFYIRKFRSGNETEAGAEVVKTINYVKNSYSMTPRTYSVIAGRTDLSLDGVRAELSALDIRPLDLENKGMLFLPG
jgi:hypothetical protein